MISLLRNSFFSLLYPQQCHVCRGTVEAVDDGLACSKCWDETRLFDGRETLCSKCGAVLSMNDREDSSQCSQCQSQSFDAARAVGVYEKALAVTILNLKSEPLVPKLLRHKILECLERSRLLSATSIIPTPLSKKRKFERGFNQAAVIAEFVSRETGINLDTHSLSRKKHTPMHRVGMDQRARELTVIGAFEIVSPRLIEGNRVLLVDDVFTSGSTASACAKVLKKHGAAEVNVFTIARAIFSRNIL